ncbi:MAG: hypothetical protein ACE5H0_13260 [Bacteroidota bacterium]
MNLDLRTLLPQLLPDAIAWAELQAKHVADVGRNLNSGELDLARAVGVQHPELIRVKLVDQLPLPEEPTLRQAALQTGLLGPGMVGLTLGYSIFIVQGYDTARLLSHECRHVYQHEVFGSIAKFLPVYLDQIVNVGYRDAPLEQDARAHEREEM